MSDNALQQARSNVDNTLSAMQQNMQAIHERDVQLNSLNDKSDQFASTADNFARSSRQLQLKLQVKQYFTYALCGLFCLDFFFYCFFPDSFWTATGALLCIGVAAHFAGQAYLR